MLENFLVGITGDIHQNPQSSHCGRKTNRHLMGEPTVLTPQPSDASPSVYHQSHKKPQISCSPVLPNSWDLLLHIAALLFIFS